MSRIRPKTREELPDRLKPLWDEMTTYGAFENQAGVMVHRPPIFEHTWRMLIESGKEEGMITMDNSLMARVKDGTIEAKEAYMKGSNKALFATMLKPGDLDGGH